MAGNYVDVPSWRMAYDRDGTQLFKLTTPIVQLTTAEISALNDESDTSYGLTEGVMLCAIFPELRDIDGFFIAGVGNNFFSPNSVEVSANTTNGVDGTWTQIQASYAAPRTVPINYRSMIKSVTALAVKGLRFSCTFGAGGSPPVFALHIYGEISPGQNPNRLMIWHPTLDERVGQAYFDWGNVPRSSSADKTFRVKNNSATLTASAVRVAMDALTDTTPSVPGQHSISKNGTTFGAQQTLAADLLPGAISPVLTLRRVTPTNAVLSLWALRVFAEAGGWA